MRQEFRDRSAMHNHEPRPDWVPGGQHPKNQTERHLRKDLKPQDLASCDGCDALVPPEQIRTITVYGSEGEFCAKCRDAEWEFDCKDQGATA